jgi:hypothetical protein
MSGAPCTDDQPETHGLPDVVSVTGAEKPVRMPKKK